MKQAQGQPGGVPTAQAPAAPAITYAKPDGWVEDPAAGMRKASFHVGADEKKLEITAIDLFLGAADLLSNVNRWRQQVELPPSTLDEVQKSVKKVSTLGVEGQLVELESPADKPPQRAIYAVLAKRPDKVWFLTMKGNAELARQERERFVEFVKSVKLAKRSGMPANHAGTPPAGTPHAGMPPAGTTRPAIPPIAPFTYKAPANWKPGEVRGMRKAAFTVTKDDLQAEVTVIDLSAKAGDLLPNVNRWREQLKLESVTQEVLDKTVKKIPVDGIDGHYVELLAAEDAKPRTGIFGLILIRGSKSWYVKMIGNAELLEAQRDSLEQFIRSIKFQPDK